MYLRTLTLAFFRNYTQLELTLEPKLYCIWGPNGAGKTNILEAIHYLCAGRSAFLHTESVLLKRDASHFTLSADICKQDKEHHLHSAYAPSRVSTMRRILRVDAKEYKKRSAYLGVFPVLMIHAQDSRMIHEASESRRRFFDKLIAHSHSHYLENLMRYNHYLKRRNVLLKSYLQHGQLDEALLDTYDGQLITLSKSLSNTRAAFIKQYMPSFTEVYMELSDVQEHPAVSYLSDVQDASWPEQYVQARAIDLRCGYTRLGIHRDDYTFTLEDLPLRTYGSQGQQKTFVLALFLAYDRMLRQEKKFFPMLLLDDVLDKLDPMRVKKLLALILNPIDEGPSYPRQVFLTSPEKVLLSPYFKAYQEKIAYIHVKEGLASLEKT